MKVHDCPQGQIAGHTDDPPETPVGPESETLDVTVGGEGAERHVVVEIAHTVHDVPEQKVQNPRSRRDGRPPQELPGDEVEGSVADHHAGHRRQGDRRGASRGEGLVVVDVLVDIAQRQDVVDAGAAPVDPERVVLDPRDPPMNEWAYSCWITTT